MSSKENRLDDSKVPTDAKWEDFIYTGDILYGLSIRCLCSVEFDESIWLHITYGHAYQCSRCGRLYRMKQEVIIVDFVNKTKRMCSRCGGEMGSEFCQHCSYYRGYGEIKIAPEPKPSGEDNDTAPR